MAAASIRIEGLAELDSDLKRLVAVADAATMDEALLAGAEPIRAEAERLTPRSRTPNGSTGKGHAQDHIAAQIKKHGKEAAVGPEKDFWYLIFAEFGTPHQAATAMFRRAADSQFVRAVVEFGAVLRAEINKVTL